MPTLIMLYDPTDAADISPLSGALSGVTFNAITHYDKVAHWSHIKALAHSMADVLVTTVTDFAETKELLADAKKAERDHARMADDGCPHHD